MDESTDAISKDCGHQSLECRGCVTITHLHYLASECAKYCGKCHLMDISSFEQYTALAISLWMISWSGNGVTSLTVLSFCSQNWKQCIVYHSSSVCRALALLDVPLQVSTTVQWCISQFSERVLCGNALGISADSSGYVFRDQLDWSHSGIPLTRSVILLSQLRFIQLVNSVEFSIIAFFQHIIA